ncbi:hypothetical protein GF337_09295 [candidate division KSB1 bacterium]|nr:hypothetical protein [candidate division KSB1 bacterium]
MIKLNKNKVMQRMLIVAVSCMLLVIIQSDLTGQTKHALTRGRFWLSSYEVKIAPDAEGGSLRMAYPGYYWGQTNSHPNEFWGREWNCENVYYGTRNGQQIRGKWTEHDYVQWHNVVVPNTLVKNYNFSISEDMPEEYMYGEIQTVPNFPDDVFDQLQIHVKCKRMVWSLPKYDDFFIEKITVINADNAMIEDFYWTLYHGMVPTYAGRSGPDFVSDDEYQWLSDLETFREEQGAFVFYDDTAIPQTSGNPVQYEISPGDVTGDIGDPGNILSLNSIDRQLYSPQVLVDNIVDCTPNKFGEKKVYQNITAMNNDASPSALYTGSPQKEQFDLHWDYGTALSTVLSDQPRKSWEELSQNPSDSAGNVYERTPFILLTAGPYDIAVGDSINILRVFCAGELDRNIAMLGGLEATEIVQQAGIDSLKKNWAAAIELIKNDYKPSAYPPPTPADAPLVGNDKELGVEIFADAETRTQGFLISWEPISESYTDPVKQYNDFVGYKVYRSEMSILGPWEEIDDLTKEEANALMQDGKIVYRHATEAGIPFRFCVTSYDDDGLESGMTGYNYYATSAKPAPSNKFADVRVVPNPFRQVSGLPDPDENKRLTFLNIPGKCTIKIFNVAGELIQTIRHDDGFGEETWGSSSENNYMLTRFAQNVMPGVYIYYIESHVEGHEGESATGKFAIIK